MSEEKKTVTETEEKDVKETGSKKSIVKTTTLKSITAFICCVTLALTSSGIATKVCDTKKELSGADGGAAGAASQSADDIFAEAEAAFADSGMTADPGVDGGTADAGAADASSTGAADSGSSSAGTTGGSSSAGTTGGSSTTKTAAKKEITLTSGLHSADKAEVLKYYKLVAAKNAKGTYTTKMTMTSLDGGSGAVGALISAFKPIATSALEKNSTTSESIPSDYDKILESDWEKAIAVNDGTYTTITVQLKNQKDGANGKTHEGTVGRTVAVLDGVQTALDNLPGVSADFGGSNFYLLYDNAYVKVKVKNSTGEFVKGSCTWHYRVNVNLDNLTVKVTIVSATLKGGKGTIDYTITY